MSQSHEEGAVDNGSTGSSGAVETAQTAAHEAAGVASTVKDETVGVVETAKSEAGAVAHEAKDQVRDLYHQTTAELKEQAAVQQRRVAEGLRSVGGELGTMAQGADAGVGADLVRQASSRLDGIAGWIGDRDPGSLLTEVKSYARRKPGTFIAVAALAGLVAGRLTRALSEGAPSTGESGSASTDADAAASAPASGPASGFVGSDASTEASRVPPLPTDGAIPAAPDGMSGIDTGTAPWGVSGEGDARDGEAADVLPGDTPLFDRTDAARGVQGEERP